MARISPELRQALTVHLQKSEKSVRRKASHAVDVLNQKNSTTAEQQRAWSDLLKVAPKITMPAILKEVRSTFKREDGAESVMTPVVGAKICFSSKEVDFPKKELPWVDYSHVSPGYEKGWEFLPLIQATVDAGNCEDPSEAIRVLEDLARIGGTGADEIMDLVAKKYFKDTPEFSRAYLKLSKMYKLKDRGEPAKEERVANFKRAMTNLLPQKPGTIAASDKELIRDSFTHAAHALRRPERSDFIESVTQERPHLREEIKEMARIALRLP